MLDYSSSLKFTFDNTHAELVASKNNKIAPICDKLFKDFIRAVESANYVRPGISNGSMFERLLGLFRCLQRSHVSDFAPEPLHHNEPHLYLLYSQ
jgi:hypothetical protein